MIRIEDYGFLVPKEFQGKIKKPKKKSSSSFWTKLEMATSDTKKQDVEDLINEKTNLNITLEESLNEITENGEKLKKRISIENLNNYKKSIKAFLK